MLVFVFVLASVVALLDIEGRKFRLSANYASGGRAISLCLELLWSVWFGGIGVLKFSAGKTVRIRGSSAC